MKKIVYNYLHYAPQSWGHKPFSSGLEIGQRFPMESILLDNSEMEHSLEKYQGQRFVLETGSLTCPSYISNVEPMNVLDEQFDNLPFFLVYVREEYPGELLSSHRSEEEKRDRALLVKTRLGERRPVFVDKLDGDLHKAIGTFPNILYVVDDKGYVEFKLNWNEPTQLQIHLSGLLSGSNSFDADTSFCPVSAGFRETISTLSKAGYSAMWDHIKSRPFVWRERKKLIPDPFHIYP